MKAFLLSIALGCASAYGQAAATPAAQQANQQCNQDQTSAHKIKAAHRPTFSVESGKLTAGTMVSISSSTRNAAIYYTTDGWMPTPESTRYTGPIAINAPTHLQAIAQEPNTAQSLIAQANYTVNGPHVPEPEAIAISGSVLHSGTPLRLVTNSMISSNTAQVGDKINLLLDEDLKANGAVVVPKGTPVQATITTTYKAGLYATPGYVAFRATSLTVHGKEIPLRCTEALLGASRLKQALALETIPIAGSIKYAKMRGHEAEIKPGMKLTANVDGEIPIAALEPNPPALAEHSSGSPSF
jgi:hypothetical protein